MREQEWLTSESPERMEEFTRPRVKELWTEFEAWRNVCMSMGDMPLPDTDSGRATWCHRYRDVFGNPFRPVVLRSNLENNINTLPATATVKDTVFYDQWLTPDVQAIGCRDADAERMSVSGFQRSRSRMQQVQWNRPNLRLLRYADTG